MSVRRTIACAVALAASVPFAGVPAAYAASTPPLQNDHPLVWTDCERGDPDAAGSECATLRVPVDWGRPDGPTFDLMLARRVARTPDAKVGSLVFGPGGPGDSGVERVRTGIDRFSTQLQNRFDIVSFDPRGVGSSSPVTCDPELLARQPSPIIESRAQFRATKEFNRRLRESCRQGAGPVFDHLDTSQTVRDLDAIRKALGERQLTFHGSSYGTLLGEQYAETYPHRLRAVVLEGVDDHSLRTRAFLDTQAAAAQDSFDEFVAWCGRTESCALHGRDVPALWRDLLARSGRGEIADPADRTHVMPPFLLSFSAFRALYGPDWAELATMLRELDLAPPPTTDALSPLPIPPTMAVFCQDWNLPVHGYREYAGHLRRLARTTPDMRYPGALMAVSYCLGAPPADNPQHRLDVRSPSTPLLLTNALHDPATGYNWATNVARQLGRDGVLHTYEGWGHGTYNSSPCVQQTVDRYLILQELPVPGSTCPA